MSELSISDRDVRIAKLALCKEFPVENWDEEMQKKMDTLLVWALKPLSHNMLKELNDYSKKQNEQEKNTSPF